MYNYLQSKTSFRPGGFTLTGYDTTNITPEPLVEVCTFVWQCCVTNPPSALLSPWGSPRCKTSCRAAAGRRSGCWPSPSSSSPCWRCTSWCWNSECEAASWSKLCRRKFTFNYRFYKDHLCEKNAWDQFDTDLTVVRLVLTSSLRGPSCHTGNRCTCCRPPEYLWWSPHPEIPEQRKNKQHQTLCRKLCDGRCENPVLFVFYTHVDVLHIRHLTSYGVKLLCSLTDVVTVLQHRRQTFTQQPRRQNNVRNKVTKRRRVKYWRNIFRIQMLILTTADENTRLPEYYYGQTSLTVVSLILY